MYAIIATGGKQYKVTNGDVIYVEKLNAEVEQEVSFDALMYSDDQGAVTIGTPIVDGVKVTGKVLKQGKGKKIVVFKYKAKKNEATKQGHRQPFTAVEITKIG